MANGGHPPFYTSSPCRWQGCSNPVLVGETYCSLCKEHILQHMWDGGCRHIEAATGHPCETPTEPGWLFCEHHFGNGEEALRPFLPPAFVPVEPVEDILDEAKRITSHDRNKSYGHPLDNFEIYATMLTGFFRNKLKPGERITADDVPWVNILQKASRAANAIKRDNFVDTAGYARTGQMVCDERDRRAADSV